MSADPKEKLLLDAEWEDTVMDLQDSEKVVGVPTQETDLLCIKVLRYLKTHRVRDKLFWERKGDEFHAMVVSLAVPARGRQLTVAVFPSALIGCGGSPRLQV